MDASTLKVSDPALLPIADKVAVGLWLDEADGVRLYNTPDLHGVGRLANFVSERLHGDVVYYNRNRHINYTNVCALSCKFCSFYRKRGESGAYEMSVDECVAAAKTAAEHGATEVHIVGGLHPWLKFDYYTTMLSGIRRECPELHIKAFTAIEIVHLSRIARLSVRDTLVALKEAGLGSLPGGGAEIFDDRVHDEAFKGKVREDKWFDVHRTAHELGLFTNATMLYGHIEAVPERVRHLMKLRALQQEALHNGRPAHFNCIIPLSFIPDQSELGHLPGPTGLTDLKTLAIARLMVPNIGSIKAFWIMQTMHLSQIALRYGCNDLDGTVVWYDITKREGHGTHQEMHVKDIQRLIREAGRTPVERDTVYREVRRDPVTDHVIERDAVTV
ncbi:MAG TPA: aminofutalosine synthase MqnE [Tepidisphaeraceae bacterium]|jgi:aminodeoxyfutalosine synthase